MKRKIVTLENISINFLFFTDMAKNPEIRKKKKEWHL